MDCPRCEGNGLIYEAKVFNRKDARLEQIYYCVECSMMWDQKEELTIEKSICFLDEHLKSLGLKIERASLIDRKPL